MMKIAIIIGSTRPGRKGEAVAKWVHAIAQTRSDAELVDIRDFNLPLLDEPMSPMMGQYTHRHTRRWSAKIASFDAYVFVTPAYNHATSGALKKESPIGDGGAADRRRESAGWTRSSPGAER